MPSAGYGATPAMRRGGADAVRQQRGAGEGVGPAAGPAERERGVGADMVEHRRRVIDDVRNGPARAP